MEVEVDEEVEVVQGKSWIILSKHPFPFSSDQRLDNLLLIRRLVNQK